MQRWRWALGLVGLVLVVAGIAGMRLSQIGVRVVVVNETEKPIRDVRVLFKGGVEVIPEVLPLGEYDFRIRPTAESDLRFEFLDADGQRHSELSDLHLPPRSRGRVRVVLDSEGEVRWHEEVRIRTAY